MIKPVTKYVCVVSWGDEGKFKQLRASELKHGRVAMLASVGLLAQCYIRFPFPGFGKGWKGMVRDFWRNLVKVDKDHEESEDDP